MWGWVREARPRDQYAAAGWASCLTLPREISLDDAGDLRVKPAAELRQLRGAALFERDLSLGPDQSDALDGARGDCLEIACRVTSANCASLAIQFRRSPDGQQFTELSYDYATGCLRLRRDQSTATPEVTTEPCAYDLRLGEGETLDLTIYLDRSVIEIYANDRLSMTSRIYPDRDDAQGLRLFAVGGSANLHARVWPMKSIWD